MVQKIPPDEEEELREVFHVLDKDKNGFISAGELRRAMNTLGKRLTDDKAGKMIRSIFNTADAQISFDSKLALRVVYCSTRCGNLCRVSGVFQRDEKQEAEIVYGISDLGRERTRTHSRTRS